MCTFLQIQHIADCSHSRRHNNNSADVLSSGTLVYVLSVLNYLSVLNDYGNCFF